MSFKTAVFRDREKDNYLRKCEKYYVWMKNTFPNAKIRVVPLKRNKRDC